MTTTSDNLDYLQIENSRLNSEVASLVDVNTQLQKKLRKAEAELQQYRMTAQVDDPSMVRSSPNRGTYHDLAGGL